MRRFIAVAVALTGVAAGAGPAHAKSEYGIFSVEVRGSAESAWHNPVGEGCIGPGQQDALRGEMRQRLRFRTSRPVAVSIAGLNGSVGPMRVRPVDLRLTGIPLAIDIHREGTVSYVDCRPGARYDECPEIVDRTRESCHVVRPVAGMEGCFGDRSYSGSAGVLFDATHATWNAGGNTRLETNVFACSPESDGFRPSSLLPGADAIRIFEPARRSALRRAGRGSVIRFNGPHFRGPDVPECKVGPPATCTPFNGRLEVTLRFVCRARRSTEGCLTAKMRKKLGLPARRP